jgi:hypothetical protein
MFIGQNVSAVYVETGEDVICGAIFLASKFSAKPV